MIVGLLIIITLVLLFGAGVVKGWLLNAIGLVLGFALMVAIGIWLNSYIEHGFIYFLLALGFVLLGGCAWVKYEQTPTSPSR